MLWFFDRWLCLDVFARIEIFFVWRALWRFAHGVQVVAGSNPVVPTIVYAGVGDLVEYKLHYIFQLVC